MDTLFKRSSGILLHPTSLPGPDGIGDLGPEAYRWVDFLHDSGCAIWQILPLGPTGYGDSPYQCFSAFAGNPLLVSPALLLADGLLTPADLEGRPWFDPHWIDYGMAIGWKNNLLQKAFDHYLARPKAVLKAEFERFTAKNQTWLDDYALFMAIKQKLGGGSWIEWPKGLRKRDKQTLQEFLVENSRAVDYQKFIQFLFFRQWNNLKKYTNHKGIHVVGDIPIFISYDSADTWVNPDLFYLDSESKPTVVSGVPPDNFSKTGQLWGTPLYRWDVHQKTGFRWWVTRIKATLEQVDIVRLDHFRGFAGYWEVKANRETAEKGAWVKGPGSVFFERLQQEIGTLPVIAEDLGNITDDVYELRDRFGLPGMKILQFAFDTPQNIFLPHQYPQYCVAYTGSHDNDTVKGWYLSADEKEKDFIRRYLARSGDDISWDLIRAVWSSVAMLAVAPMQDFLSLGSEARMNYPSRLGGNWAWRLDGSALQPGLSDHIREINFLYDRLMERPAKRPAMKPIHYREPGVK